MRNNRIKAVLSEYVLQDCFFTREGETNQLCGPAAFFGSEFFRGRAGGYIPQRNFSEQFAEKTELPS